MNMITHAPSDHVVFTEFDGGEGVLVDLNTKRYYQLNETATLVWRALEKGKGKDEIVEEFTRLYEVTEEHALNSLDKILHAFQSYGLLKTG